MRVKIGLEEYQISGINAKRTVAGGHYVARDGVLCKGVEDITQYDKDGNEIIPEVVDEDII